MLRPVIGISIYGVHSVTELVHSLLFLNRYACLCAVIVFNVVLGSTYDTAHDGTQCVGWQVSFLIPISFRARFGDLSEGEDGSND